MDRAGPGIAASVNLIDTVKEHLRGVAERIVGEESAGVIGQTVTVARPVSDVEQFWRDPKLLSAVLGGVGEVMFAEPDTYHWHLSVGDHELQWSSRLVAGGGGLQYRDDDAHQIVIGYRPAPHQLGTEVTLTAELPAPGLLAGATAFTVLYRMRALLQTGEIPTLTGNPSGRS